MKLIIEDDEGRKTVVPIVREDVEITIGRQEGNTIRLTERNVSRKHAKLSRKSAVVSIEDLGSFNGIKVNGDRIQGALQLKEGDLVQIGDYDLAIQSEEQKASAPQASAAAAPAHPAAGSEPTLQSEVPEGEDIAPAGAAPGQITAAAAAKKHDATSIISGAQLKRGAPTRRIVDIAPESAPRLLLTTTELAGREFACIRTELKIGRTDDNDIAIDHRSISRNHCKVVREDNGEWRVIDLQSANGVRVNGEQYAESVLKPGDVLELGHLHFKFLAPGEEAPAAGAEEGHKRSNLGLLIGGGIVFAAVAIIGGYLAMRHRHTVEDDNLPPIVKTPKAPDEPKRPDQPKIVTPVPVEPPPEVPPVDPKVVKMYEEGKAHLAKHEWAKAEKKLARAKDYGVEEAAPLLGKARMEMEAEKDLAEAQKKLGANDLAGARSAAQAIPPESYCAASAKPLLAQITAAEEKAKKAAEKPPEGVNKDAEKRLLAESLYEQGNNLFKVQKKKEAAGYFRKSVEADPTFPRSHLYLGICLGAEGNPDEAARQFEEFLHLAPTDPNAPAVIPILRDYLKKAPNFKLRWPLPPPPP